MQNSLIRSHPRVAPLFVVFFVVGAMLAPAQRFTDWSAPVNLGATINAPQTAVFFPSITKDGLSLYFTASGRGDGFGGWDIYVCSRASTNDPWGAPQNLGPNVNTQDDEGAPFVSTDGHRLYFQSNRVGGFGGGDLYVSRRRDKIDDFGWQPPENLGPGVNSDANEAGPSQYEDDTGTPVLYFSSDRPGGPGPIGPNMTGVNGQQGSDIYVSTQHVDGVFGSAVLVPELSSVSLDRRPFVRHDGLEIFLSSDRTGTKGAIDIWAATRSSTHDPWTAPVNLGSLVNGTRADAGAAISFDRTSLFYQSVRADNITGTTSYNLWMTTRTRLKGLE